MSNYIELPRLIDKYTEQEFKTLLTGYLDNVTAGAVYEHFAFRRLNTVEEISGVNVWEHHLKEQLNLISEQYKQYVRIETVEIDPLVTDYIERQILKTGSGTTTETKTETNARTFSFENGETVTTTPGITETKTTAGTTETAGKDNTDSGETLNRSITETRNTTDTTTGNRFNDRRQMSSQLPHSISYSSGGTSERDSGIPSSLDWTTATAQSESDELENSNTTTTGGGTVTTNETGTPTSYNDNEFSSNVKANGTETTTRTGTDTTTKTGTNDGTSSVNVNGSNSVTASTDDDMRERATGRTGRSPQELLEEAKNYILRTNSFEWLCDKLNENFVWLAVYY